MLRTNNFTKFFGVKVFCAISQNGMFQIDSAIYKNRNNQKLYTYYDYKTEQYITEKA